MAVADVARKANASIGTVSRVLNRPQLVNDKTRKRVENVMAQLEFRPSTYRVLLFTQGTARVAVGGDGD